MIRWAAASGLVLTFLLLLWLWLRPPVRLHNPDSNNGSTSPIDGNKSGMNPTGTGGQNDRPKNMVLVDGQWLYVYAGRLEITVRSEGDNTGIPGALVTLFIPSDIEAKPGRQIATNSAGKAEIQMTRYSPAPLETAFVLDCIAVEAYGTKFSFRGKDKHSIHYTSLLWNPLSEPTKSITLDIPRLESAPLDVTVSGLKAEELRASRLHYSALIPATENWVRKVEETVESVPPDGKCSFANAPFSVDVIVNLDVPAHFDPCAAVRVPAYDVQARAVRFDVNRAGVELPLIRVRVPDICLFGDRNSVFAYPLASSDDANSRLEAEIDVNGEAAIRLKPGKWLLRTHCGFKRSSDEPEVQAKQKAMLEGLVSMGGPYVGWKVIHVPEQKSSELRVDLHAERAALVRIIIFTLDQGTPIIWKTSNLAVVPSPNDPEWISVHSWDLFGALTTLTERYRGSAFGKTVDMDVSVYYCIVPSGFLIIKSEPMGQKPQQHRVQATPGQISEWIIEEN